MTINIWSVDSAYNFTICTLKDENMLLCCVARESCDFLAVTELPGGVIPYQEIRGLVPKFESEILVGAPNFASKNISDKYPKFCPLNFRYDPKIIYVRNVM